MVDRLFYRLSATILFQEVLVMYLEMLFAGLCYCLVFLVVSIFVRKRECSKYAVIAKRESECESAGEYQTEIEYYQDKVAVLSELVKEAWKSGYVDGLGCMVSVTSPAPFKAWIKTEFPGRVREIVGDDTDDAYT